MKAIYTLGILCSVIVCALFITSKVIRKTGDNPPVKIPRDHPTGHVQTEPITGIPERSANERAMDRKLFEIHEKWLGTPWAFSGTTQVAGEGSIACGYFVTTTLREAGIEVDRVRLAQAASETMILEITNHETVRRFSDSPLIKVISSIQKQGEGYYIVGLDNHTGFLKVETDGGVVFIHSGPGKGVVIETPEKSNKLSSSRYRVTGKISWAKTDG